MRLNRVGRALLLATLSSLLTACVQNVRDVSEGDELAFSTNKVYFATNRNVTGKENLNNQYGGGRSKLIYGTSLVAVPLNYARAQKASFLHWNLPLRRNPEKYVAVVNNEQIPASLFFRLIDQQAHAAQTNNALVFIHGYNTSFERATRIVAKLAYDINLQGPSIMFSWPSEATTAKYMIDEVNLEWSQPVFEDFLRKLFMKTDIQDIYFLAHSLGNRALTHALIALLNEQPEYAQRIGGVILAAPDMDSAVFARDIIPKLTAHHLPITLYTSSNDIALIASQKLHRYSRAGEAGPEIVVLPGMDTIDATLSEAELFGHEYFSQGAQTIEDIYQWIIEDKPVEERKNLVAVHTSRGIYWRIVPPEITQLITIPTTINNPRLSR